MWTASRLVVTLLSAGSPAVSQEPPGSVPQMSAPAVEVAPAGGAPPTAVAHGNVTPAGVLRDGVLSLQLIAQRVRWHPEADDGPVVEADAFGEVGATPTIPGPLVRVPVGTRVETRIHNALPYPLLVFGLSGRGDTIRIAPGASGSARFTAGAPGTYGYGGATILRDSVNDLGTGNQLLGALVVDSVGAPPDRIFVMSTWPRGAGFIMAMNGKSWPHTERFDMSVGDSVHWRVINGTGKRHPMHLHGFYFRIDARGSWDADTAMTGQRPSVVTESVPYRGTFSMTWAPTRPGNWLFHCHDAFHVTWRRRYNMIGEPPPPTLPMHSADHHAEMDMSGLVIGIRVRGGAGGSSAAELATPRRRLRMMVNEKAGFYGRDPGFSYIASNGRDPARDSLQIPAAPLVLTRGEPTQISVVNRLTIPTAVHWHGIELDSYYDGLAGWSGDESRLAPLIQPEDSFAVRITAPRAGTFMFHAHVDDLRQIALGLYGALIVLPPGETFDRATDHPLIISQLGRGTAAVNGINGSATPEPMMLAAGVHRFRFINITVMDDAELALLSGSTPLAWRALAKDGADLHPDRAVAQPAVLSIAPGETYDFEVTLPAGDYRLTMNSYTDLQVTLRVR
jgi:manganese oxidase